MNEDIEKKIIQSSKWSFTTELFAKLVTPATNMILARLLLPEAFGIVATITMVLTFAEMLSDAGFQKYIVQHNFRDKDDQKKQFLVAFWTNLFVSLILWVTIWFFDEDIACLLGNPGIGCVYAVAGFSIPLVGIASIQMALLRREFRFDLLFKIRMVAVFIPIVITIPLAYLGYDYWSLVVGTIVANMITAIILLINSPYTIKIYYDIYALREMLSFSLWSLIEAISIWLTSWVDAFIIGALLSSHYLGLYMNSMTAVNACLNIITGAIIPVLFVALSRLQNNEIEFKNTFYSFQKIAALIAIPMGVGIYCYSDVLVSILFGEMWHEADLFVGWWGLSSAVIIVFGFLNSEVYRAKGQPKLSFYSQILHLIVLVPTIYISASYGFENLIYARSLVRLQSIIVGAVFLNYFFSISFVKSIKLIFPVLVASFLMAVLSILMRPLFEGLVWSIVTIFICIAFYFSALLLVPNYRRILVRGCQYFIMKDK